MKEKDMVCTACFYGEPLHKDGEGARIFCKANPKPSIIGTYRDTDVCTNVYTNPNSHRCGRGRWWENGKWIRWIDKENE